MVDSARAIINEKDGSSEAHARLTCLRCDKVTYVYAENKEVAIITRDLPNFCRDCGQAFQVWTLEYVRAWGLSDDYVRTYNKSDL